MDVPYDMPARRHVALRWFIGCDIDDCREEVSFAMLAAEVLDRELAGFSLG